MYTTHIHICLCVYIYIDIHIHLCMYIDSHVHGNIKLDYHQIITNENGATTPTYRNTCITYMHTQISVCRGDHIHIQL